MAIYALERDYKNIDLIIIEQNLKDIVILLLLLLVFTIVKNGMELLNTIKDN